VRRPDLLSEAKRFRAEDAVLRKDGYEVFLTAHDKRGDAGAPPALHRLGQ